MNQKDSTTEILNQINKTMKGRYGVVPFLMLYDVFSLSVVLEFSVTDPYSYKLFGCLFMALFFENFIILFQGLESSLNVMYSAILLFFPSFSSSLQGELFLSFCFA